MLCVTLKYGDILKIGDSEIYVQKYSSNQVRFYVEADKSLKIERMDMNYLTQSGFRHLSKEDQDALILKVQTEFKKNLVKCKLLSEAESKTAKDLNVSKSIVIDNTSKRKLGL